MTPEEMTQELYRQVLRRLDSLDENRTETTAQLAQLNGNVETLCARVEAHTDRSGEEIKALFAKSRETAQKVEEIRVDYVRRHDFENHERQNREEHAAFEKRINALGMKIAMWSGGLSLGAFILGLLIRGIGAFGR